MRQRVSLAALSATVLLFSSSSIAYAQPKKGNEPFILKRDQLGSVANGEAARARARKGDCAGALPMFDEAIRVSIEPALRRDRGLCHEKLGDVFPAIDDFRAYLTASPEAADAEPLRARLYALEAKAGVGGLADESEGNTAPKGEGVSASFSASAANGGNVHTDSVQDEEDDDTTPLRRGKGLVLGPQVGYRMWLTPDRISQSLGAVHVDIRAGYSLGRVATFFGELGYQRFNENERKSFTLSGLTSQVGFEFRLPLKKSNPDDFWLLGLGVDYEHLVATSTSALTPSGSVSFGALGPRFRFGYRHNLVKSAAIEFSLDGAPFVMFPISNSGSSTTVAMFGLNVALVFGP